MSCFRLLNVLRPPSDTVRRCQLQQDWKRGILGRSIKRENVKIAGGYVGFTAKQRCFDTQRCRSVPSMVTDLVEGDLAGHHLDSIMFGGSAAPDQLPDKARRTFPDTTLYVRTVYVNALT